MCSFCTFSCVFSLYVHEYLQVQQSVGLDWQVGHTESFRLQNATRVKNTFMLRLRGDHMTLLGLVEPGHALQEREVGEKGSLLTSQAGF